MALLGRLAAGPSTKQDLWRRGGEKKKCRKSPENCSLLSPRRASPRAHWAAVWASASPARPGSLDVGPLKSCNLRIYWWFLLDCCWALKSGCFQGPLGNWSGGVHWRGLLVASSKPATLGSSRRNMFVSSILNKSMHQSGAAWDRAACLILSEKPAPNCPDFAGNQMVCEGILQRHRPVAFLSQ